MVSAGRNKRLPASKLFLREMICDYTATVSCKRLRLKETHAKPRALDASLRRRVTGGRTRRYLDDGTGRARRRPGSKDLLLLQGGGQHLHGPDGEFHRQPKGAERQNRWQYDHVRDTWRVQRSCQPD